MLTVACAAALAVSGAGAARAAQSGRVVLAGTGYQSDYGLIDQGPADPISTVTDVVYLSVRDPGTWQYTERRFGGTSLSTPLFAGVQALAQQARGGKPFGFANPTLYSLAGTAAFRDITKLTGPVPAAVALRQNSATGFGLFLFQMYGQVPSTLGIPVTTNVGPGFDTETGIGIPTSHYLSLPRTGKG